MYLHHINIYIYYACKHLFLFNIEASSILLLSPLIVHRNNIPNGCAFIFQKDLIVCKLLFVMVLFINIIIFIYQAVDAIDNGINQYDTVQPPRYVNNTHLSSRVGKLNLDWMDPDQSPEKENEAFEKAMNLTGREFLDVRFFRITGLA